MVPCGIGMTRQGGRKCPQKKSEAKIPIHFLSEWIKRIEFNTLAKMAWLLLNFANAELPDR